MRSSLRVWFTPIVLAGAAVPVLALGGEAGAACYGPQRQLPAQTISHFSANPAQLLTQYPNGGAQLISVIRDMAGSDPAALTQILDLVATANADQLDAIGTGLGQTALVCVRTDPLFADEIRQMVAAAGNQAVVSAFAAVTGTNTRAAVRGRGNAPHPAQLPSQTVAQFTADPSLLLAQFPAGGAPMAAMIQSLVASERTTLPLIIGLLAAANAEQLVAIGTGLGQAALFFAFTDPTFANEIQQAVTTADNQTAALAFAAVMGDLFLAEDASGGGGESATDPPAGVGGISGGSTPSLSTSVKTTPASVTFSFTSGGSVPIGRSVSPSRP